MVGHPGQPKAHEFCVRILGHGVKFTVTLNELETLDFQNNGIPLRLMLARFGHPAKSDGQPILWSALHILPPMHEIVIVLTSPGCGGIEGEGVVWFKPDQPDWKMHYALWMHIWCAAKVGEVHNHAIRSAN